MTDLTGVSAEWLKKQKASLLEQSRAASQRAQKAKGVVVIKGTGHRPSKVRIAPGRRDPVALGKAEATIREISRKLQALEAERERRATVDAPAWA